MGKKTRSATRPTIANVETLRSRQFATRAAVDSLSIDTLLYFVNFADNQGFAVVAADKRTSPILALIDKGNYKAGDLSQEDNPGFLSFLDYAVKHEIENTHDNNENSKNVRSFKYRGWQISEIAYPLLKVNWGQGYPYNIFCPGYKDMPHANTGCVITAFAQICSFYKVPKELSWNSYGTWVHWTYNWDRIISDCKKNDGNILNRSTYSDTAEEVASLMNYLGLAFRAKYERETGASVDDAINFVNGSNWFHATPVQDYNEHNIFVNIRNGNLVLGRGNAEKGKTWIFFNKYSRGHAWIYDGFINGISPKGKEYNLLHCNWGWNGYKNGYYYCRVFNTNDDPVFDNVPTRSNQAPYYRYNLQYSLITPTQNPS